MILSHGIIVYKPERGNTCIADTLFFGRPFSELRLKLVPYKLSCY